MNLQNDQKLSTNESSKGKKIIIKYIVEYKPKNKLNNYFLGKKRAPDNPQLITKYFKNTKKIRRKQN